MRRRSLWVILLVLLTVTACTTAAPVATPIPPTAANATPTIALVMKTLSNPFFVEMEKGARQAEKDLGIKLVVRTAAQETSIEQQIQIVDDLIAQKVNAIVIAPGDSIQLIPVLKKAQDAGTTIINIDNKLDAAFAQKTGLVNVPFISVDNENGAYLSAKYIADKVTAPAEAIILEGIRSAKNADDRKNGAVRAFKGNANIKVVGMETANWKIDEAYTATKKLFEANPNIKLVFAANDVMAFGAIKYLTEQKKTDVMVAGYDALDDAKAAIKQGTMLVTIDQQAAKQGYTGVQYAVRALKGEKLAPETMLDVLVVDASALK
jgi:ribose transport system substrate-binding protein